MLVVFKIILHICTKFNTVCRKATSFCGRFLTMFTAMPQNDVDRKRSNDVVPCGHKHKKKDTIFIVSFFLELLADLFAFLFPGGNGKSDSTR